MALFDPGEHPAEFPAEVVSDFTVQDILAWARSKPASQEYYYWCNQCAVGQFLADTGRAKTPLMGELWWVEHGVGDEHAFDPRITKAAYRRSGEWSTLGAFADRLEALAK